MDENNIFPPKGLLRTSERSLFNKMEKSQYERPGPARPETHLRGSYLSNHLTDSLAVFFIG